MDVAYCTNIHAGADLQTAIEHLERIWPHVRRQVSSSSPLPLGLWFSARTAREMLENRSCPQLREWLGSQGLCTTTINGFPFGDFHHAQVKRDVYEPNWFSRARWEYTNDLIAVATDLVPAGSTISISTLPLSWGDPVPSPEKLWRAAQQLQETVRRLQQIQGGTGTTIRLCLEPEPGCYLQRSNDVVQFMEEYMFRGPDEPRVREFLGVCHDICHAAVMHEDQSVALAAYRSAGIRVGKIQVSSAIRTDFQPVHSADELAVRWEQLRTFAEDRYMHQTTIWDGGRLEFHDDLPDAIAKYACPTGEWRVHFHVPIHFERLGALQTTQADIDQVLSTIANDPHYHRCSLEVETYAWSVLPEPVRSQSIDANIAAELNWLRARTPC